MTQTRWSMDAQNGNDEEPRAPATGSEEEAALSKYLRVVQCENEQEELLDSVAILERRIRFLRKEATQRRHEVIRVRDDAAHAQEETLGLRTEAERERTERQALERELERHKSNGASAPEENDKVLDELILVKTKLAQAMEERERRKLERKKLEDQLATLKCSFAASMADLNDEEDRCVRDAIRAEGAPPESLQSAF